MDINYLIYIDLIMNLALLIAMTILSGFIDKRLKRSSIAGTLVQGFLFGCVALIGMLRPLNLGPGLIFDGRSVMISLCSLFFGPLAAAVACVAPIAYRISLGGSGAIMGVLVILESALVGLGSRYVFKPDDRPPTPVRLYLIGLIVHAIMLGLMFTLPDGAGITVFRRIGFAVIVVYPLATILAGTILSDHLKVEKGIEALRESEARFKFSMEATSDGLWDMDVRTDTAYFNPSYYHILGYEAGEFPAVTSSWSDRIHPDDLQRALQGNIDCIEGRTDYIDVEYRLKAKDDSWKWIYARGKCVERDAKDRALRLVGTHVDISERKSAEEKILQSLEEKEVLLREVHHRVKNNLSIISSLLNLQAERIQTPEEAVAAFLNSKDRILAMALVHEELYKSGDFSRMDMARYLEDLTQSLISAYNPDLAVEVDIKVEKIFLSLNASIPCGLILNELITNAFKHAFPGGKSGKLQVLFKNTDAENLEFSIADTGIGLPRGFESGTGTSLGLTLVRGLVEQLDGALEISVDNGTCFRIRFPQKRFR